MTAFFFYGTLCHPPLLSAVLGREAVLQPAALEDHASYWAAGQAFPLIREERGGRALGVLAEGLSAEEVARLDYYEAGFAYATRDVAVEADGRRVSARVYFPDPGAHEPGPAWDLADWAARHGAAASQAAAHFMGGFGRIPQAEAHRRYHATLAAAGAAVRAQAAPPTELRRRAAPDDLAVLAAEEPYARFFAVREYDLVHRRFDGDMSAPLHRAVFSSGDAAVVLPYDPARDRVLLIEQFRAGPFGRGDPQPWTLEAVAGRIDPGETPEEAARREAMEEAGLVLGRLERAGEYYPSPGMLAEYLYTFVGLADLPDAAAGFGGLHEEQEDIRVHILPFPRLMELVASGEVQAGPLLIATYWLALNRERIRLQAAAG